MVGPLIGARRRDGAAGPARSADATDGPDRPRAASTNSPTARPKAAATAFADWPVGHRRPAVILL
jgi:hypothetical protein